MVETIKKDLGRRLRTLRKTLNMTAEELAEKLSVHPNTVYTVERGEQWVSPELLDKMGAKLNVPIAYFFTDDVVKIEPTPQEALEVLARAIQAPKPQLPAAVVDVLRGVGEWNQDKIDALSALVMGFQVAANSPNQRKDAHKSRA